VPALAQAGLSIEQISGAGFGVAGYDFPSERAETLQTIARLGLVCPFDATNDVALGLIAGAAEGWGIVIDSGTGNNVRGRDRNGREGWVTGCGGTFGEYGGAGEIVEHALQKVAHHWSRRGPATALSDAMVKAVGAKNLSDLIEGVALGWYHLDAGNARLVFEVARTGDVQAIDTLTWAGRELGETANAVIRQLEIQTECLDVVLIGGGFNGGPLLLDPLKQTILNFAPCARFTRLEAPPATGGVLLGMEQVGLRDATVRERLLQTTHDFGKR
jgi:N-acetylglucosamine kinase-like BadF-type ATPase